MKAEYLGHYVPLYMVFSQISRACVRDEPAYEKKLSLLHVYVGLDDHV